MISALIEYCLLSFDLKVVVIQEVLEYFMQSSWLGIFFFIYMLVVWSIKWKIDVLNNMYLWYCRCGRIGLNVSKDGICRGFYHLVYHGEP